MGFSKYPTQLDDSTSIPPAIDNVTPVAAECFNRLRDALLATQAELGTDPSRSFGTVRDRLDALRGEINTLNALVAANTAAIAVNTSSIITINSTLASDLNKIKISSTDTTSGFLDSKLIAGTNIVLSKLGTGANEQFKITATGGGGGGGSGGAPTPDDKDKTSTVTTGDGQTTGVTLTNLPFSNSYVRVDVNSLSAVVGDGIKTKDCYFSSDSGTTAKAISSIVAGDQLIWNGLIAGFNLDATDRVDLHYDVI